MRFSELKPGDKIVIRNGWREIPNDSIYLILSMNPTDRAHIIKYMALTPPGIVSGEFWMDSDVDLNRVFGTWLSHWDLL